METLIISGLVVFSILTVVFFGCWLSDEYEFPHGGASLVSLAIDVIFIVLACQTYHSTYKVPTSEIQKVY